MLEDDDPYCPVCGGPFNHVELQDFDSLAPADEYLSSCAYDSRLLPPAQCDWIQDFQLLAKSIPQNESPLVGKSMSVDSAIFISAQARWKCYREWYTNAPDWVETEAVKESYVKSVGYDEFYPVHSACIKILEYFVQDTARKAHRHLFEVMRDFVDACAIRESHCDFRTADFWANGKPAPQPRDFPIHPKVEWSHLYFGARHFWADPWDCEPEAAYLCANPLDESKAKEFIQACLYYPQSTRSYSKPSLTGWERQVHMEKEEFQRGISSKVALINFPGVVISKIISYLPLRSGLNLCAAHSTLIMSKPSANADHWASHTLRLHGQWLYELEDFSYIDDKSNWETLLQILETSRCEFLWGEKSSTIKISDKANRITEGQSGQHAINVLPSMPLEVKNRQRIWMCLEYCNMKGMKRLPTERIPDVARCE